MNKGAKAIVVLMAALATLGLLSPEPVLGEPEKESGKVSQEATFARHMTQAIKFIGENHVTAATHPQMTRWSVNGLFMAMKVPVPAEIGKRLEKLEEPDLPLLFQDVWVSLGKRKRLDTEHAFKICVTAILAHLEPGATATDGSKYITSEDRGPRFICGIQTWGIGLEVVNDPATGLLKVVTPIYNGPAYQAGVRGGDLITHIRIDTDPWTGEARPQPEVFSTKGMSVERAYELFRGLKRTRVILQVIPAGAAEKSKN